jgi:predicted nucleotidyltransferase
MRGTRLARRIARQEGEIMLDQQTKQQFQSKFQQIKPQLQQQFPELEEQDLQKGQSDPDQLVKAAAQKTGQPEMQIEQQLEQLVQQS